MTHSALFSASYLDARARFKEALGPAGFTHESHVVEGLYRENSPLRAPGGDTLTIDVGIRRGTSNKNALVISSGLHGIEGFFGSAVQLGLLTDARWCEAARTHTIVFVHALNPYGFAWKRRANEDNVDLNRSFFSAGEPRPETIEDFHAFVDVLCPKSPPPRVDLSPLIAVWHIARQGFAKLKRTIPVGQYDYPCCIFYGGSGPSETQNILESHAGRWVGDAGEVQLIDLHTGLGPWGTYKILLGEDKDRHELDVTRNRFGSDHVEDPAVDQEAGKVFYPARGTFLPWFKTLFPGRTCHAAMAEFGTYANLRVLQSLRAEHRAHFYGDCKGKHAWTKTELLEMFAPASPVWRDRVITGSKDIFHRAVG